MPTTTDYTLDECKMMSVRESAVRGVVGATNPALLKSVCCTVSAREGFNELPAK